METASTVTQTSDPMPIFAEDTYLGWETLETCDGCGPGVNALWLVLTRSGILTLCGAHYRRFRAERSRSSH